MKEEKSERPMSERDELLNFLYESVDKLSRAIPSYLIAMSISVAVNTLIISQFVLSGMYPLHFALGFIVAPLYLLLLPFLCILRMNTAERRFYSFRKKTFLEEESIHEKNPFKKAESYADMAHFWWKWALFALIIYWWLSFVLVYLLMWILW